MAASDAPAPPAPPAPVAPVAKKLRFALGDEPESTEPTFATSYPSDARKLDVLRRNPMVPIGAGVTAGVLLAGLFAFNRGSQLWSQRMMRARVVAQGATLGVLAWSVYRVKDGVQPDGLTAALSD